jgi:hypothetical protein
MCSSRVDRPIDLLRFVSLEHEQFLVSIANNREEFLTLSHLQGLYEAALSDLQVAEENMVLFQLLAFAHYHFLFSTASLMRCHLSEAFASTRAAIDAALIGAVIIDDRTRQIAYAKREKPFDNLARYLGNLAKDGKPMPHPLVPVLREVHKTLSRFASHADVDSFVHRVKFEGERGSQTFRIEYFQFSRDEVERKLHALNLFLGHVMVLDVFSDFLVVEQKVVPLQWQNELRELGATIERRKTALVGTRRKTDQNQSQEPKPTA